MTHITLTTEQRALARQLSDRLIADLRGNRCHSTSTAATTTVSRPAWIQSLQDHKFLRKLSHLLPYCAMGGVAAVYLAANAPVLAIGVGLLAAVKVIVGRAKKNNPVIQRMLAKIGHRKYMRMIAALLFGGTLWGALNGNAYAQFFQGAEDFFTTTFGDAAGETIPIVFGVLRALFLLYIGVSLIRVINAGRNDDDWQQMAKAPIIVVMAVVVADVLTTLVVGAG
ncbi:MAG: hypothetical protein AAF773_08670 [Cyanobacteria bacterium P01_D01_bin.115]